MVMIIIIFLMDIIWPVTKGSVRWIMKSKNEMIRFISIHLSSIIFINLLTQYCSNNNRLIIRVSNFHNYFNKSLRKIESF